MQPTITPTKTFKLKTHLIFTTIEIEKVGIYKPNYVATFKTGSHENYLKEITIKAKGIQSLLEKVSYFLDCQIDEKHYIIK